MSIYDHFSTCIYITHIHLYTMYFDSTGGAATSLQLCRRGLRHNAWRSLSYFSTSCFLIVLYKPTFIMSPSYLSHGFLLIWNNSNKSGTYHDIWFCLTRYATLWASVAWHWFYYLFYRNLHILTMQELMNGENQLRLYICGIVALHNEQFGFWLRSLHLD